MVQPINSFQWPVLINSLFSKSEDAKTRCHTQRLSLRRRGQDQRFGNRKPKMVGRSGVSWGVRNSIPSSFADCLSIHRLYRFFISSKTDLIRNHTYHANLNMNSPLDTWSRRPRAPKVVSIASTSAPTRRWASSIPKQELSNMGSPV